MPTQKPEKKLSILAKATLFCPKCSCPIDWRSRSYFGDDLEFGVCSNERCSRGWYKYK